MKKKRINRRTVSRYSVVVTVRFRWLDDLSEGATTDLSARGCTITASTRPPLARGSFLIIHLYLPRETTPVLVNPAVVRWVQETRFAVEFIGNRPVDEQRLSWFLEEVKANVKA